MNLKQTTVQKLQPAFIVQAPLKNFSIMAMRYYIQIRAQPGFFDYFILHTNICVVFPTVPFAGLSVLIHSQFLLTHILL